MPRIGFFYGISIYMYWNEAHHARPHFHARYGGQVASIDLNGEVIAGSLRGGRRRSSRRGHVYTVRSSQPTGNAPGARTSLSRWNPFPSIGFVEQLLDVTAVEVVGSFRLRLSFEDGTVGDVDFSGREWRGVLEPLSDPSYFARVQVDPEAGTVAWPGGIDLAPEPLYEEARRNLVERTSSSR